MNTFDAIYNRRAVKQFDPNYAISKEDEDKLLELAAQTPSSFNIQHWRLVKVSDRAMRQKIFEYSQQQQVLDASLLYVVTTDIKAWQKSPHRYWENAPKEAQDFLVPWIGKFYEGKEQLQRDEAMRSVGMIAQTIMLAAKAMGLDSCPMIGFDIDAVAKLINLPSDHAIGMIIVVGKGIKDPHPKPGFIPRDEMVIENSFA